MTLDAGTWTETVRLVAAHFLGYLSLVRGMVTGEALDR